jgi:GT2 family glycosyltransferase
MTQDVLDIIIISYNCREYTTRCIDSIYENKGELDVRVFVVDNASTDDTVEFLRLAYPDVRIYSNNTNDGYAKAVNAGAKISESDVFIVTNADVLFHKETLKQLERTYKSENAKNLIGAAGVQQVFPNGSWEFSYGDFPGIKCGFKKLLLIYSIVNQAKRVLWKNGIPLKKSRIVPYLDGAMLAINRKAFNSVNGFDEDYFFYSEEADFCYKLKKKGWQVLFVPEATIMHVRGASSNNNLPNEKYAGLLIDSKILFCRKHLSGFTTKSYIFLEALHSGILYLLVKIPIKLGIDKERFKHKDMEFLIYYRKWIKELFNNFS